MKTGRICVFCGSRPGRSDAYRDAAVRLGEAMDERQLGLVFGGGRVGLMGIVADTLLERGREVVGVIPHGLMVREVGHAGVTELRVVASMHERKSEMAALSDGFVALPGGLGTLEELFEALTWLQLGIHRKPVGLLNIGGYWDPLLRAVDHAIEEGFVDPGNRALMIVDERPGRLLDRMAAYESPVTRAWLEPDEI